MRSTKIIVNRYLNRYDAFRGRSLFFRLTVILFLTVIFSFTISRCWQLMSQGKDYPGGHGATIAAGLGAFKK
ncbi:hypothetical protein [Pseudocnuella soli]|uniref:hypothetical protein n=1 Tax=Pseudocnuella soli TaxID=2502779 RepID=UPI0010535A82|nr:hypothetical protein [Pseudocnuella soli]